MMLSQKTWRDYLKNLFTDRHFRQNLARELRVNPTTLTRWTWTSKPIEPHRGHLERLLSAETLSEVQRETLSALLKEDYPDLEPAPHLPDDDGPFELIPSSFYKLILHTRAKTEPDQIFSTVVQLIQQEIRQHLAPIYATILLLTPPQQKGPVRSLYHPIRPYGNRPASLPQMFPIFIGLEFSMSMILASHAEPFVFSEQEMQANLEYLPASLHELRGSKTAVVIPLQQGRKLGGCFIIISQQVDFFDEKTRLEIAVEYGNLLSLALRDADFYDPKNISLGLLPSVDLQLKREREDPFMNRMKRIQAASAKQSLPLLNMEDLEWLALQDLEDELIQAMRD